MKPGATGITRIIKATGFSLAGLRAAFHHEAAFRQECLLFLVAIPCSLLLGRTPLEITLLITSVGLVLVVELLNSAIEAVVDRISNEPHELSGRAKDIGSAAVFITLVLASLLWITIAWSRFAS